MLDCSQMSFAQMADLIRAIRLEVLNRNPPYAQQHVGVLIQAINTLETLSSDHDDPDEEL